MKKLTLVLFAVLMLVACKKDKTDATTTETKDTISDTVPKEAEWMSLFDGSSLDNWRGYLTDSIHKEWTIEDDGSMVFTPSDKGGKNIISKQKFTNFVLSLEWKISAGGNSGIFWGVYEDEKYPEAYQTGAEIQVLDNELHADAKVANGTHKAGSLYDMIACPDEHVNPAGEWNLCVLEINHETNLGKVTMNGTEVMTFPVHGEDWDAMVADSKFNGWEGFAAYRTGHIGLQDHSDKVWYKNIKIKEL
jgi:hypothetical protein